MEQPFEIRFDFVLAHSELRISLKATAELHHSEPYYVVRDFALADSGRDGESPSILPPQEIKCIRRGNERLWVHKDSERESLLSISMGNAIDAATGSR